MKKVFSLFAVLIFGLSLTQSLSADIGHKQEWQKYMQKASEFFENNEAQKSVPWLEKALQSAVKYSGNKGNEFFETMYLLAKVVSKLKQYELLETTAKGMIEVIKETEKHYDKMAEVIEFLAFSYAMRSKYKEAAEYYTYALKLRELDKTKTTPLIKTSRALAVVHIQLKDFEKAEPLLERVIQLQEKDNKTTSQGMCVSLYYLGKAYHHLNKTSKLLITYKRALPICRNAFGAENATVKNIKKLVALFEKLPQNKIDSVTQWKSFETKVLALTEKGSYQKAKSLVMEMIQFSKEQFGKNSEYLGYSYILGTMVFSQQGRFLTARGCADSALQIFKKISGPNSKQVQMIQKMIQQIHNKILGKG